MRFFVNNSVAELFEFYATVPKIGTSMLDLWGFSRKTEGVVAFRGTRRHPDPEGISQIRYVFNLSAHTIPSTLWLCRQEGPTSLKSPGRVRHIFVLSMGE
jgi:hypothetical protein